MKNLIYAFVILLTLSACGNRQQTAKKYSDLDSLIDRVALMKDGVKTIALADSLEAAGEISFFRACCLRGEAYVELFQFAKAEEEFRKVYDATPENYEDSIQYFNCVNALVQQQIIRKDHDAVLRTAVPMLETLENLTVTSEHADEIYDMKLVLAEGLGSTPDATR